MWDLLYERIFKHYTKKQWDKYPAELDALGADRLPCRTSADDRYFGDAWQALPVRGYTRIFENMLLRDPKITIKLNVDFFAAREAGLFPAHGKLVFTGPIDAYFAAQGLPKLEYRSLRFEEEFIEEPEDEHQLDRPSGQPSPLLMCPSRASSSTSTCRINLPSNRAR